jgi:sRNA-binding protein
MPRSSSASSLGAEGARDLGWILSQHVQRYMYQKRLATEGAVRLDLDGKPAGEVTPEQRERTTKTLERLKAKVKARDAGK